jgi:ABC-type glycerol-3-phosphate transport system permease component
MISTSLKRPEDIYTLELEIIPLHPTFENYMYLIRETSYTHYLINSFTIAIIVALITTIIISPAAYALSRFNLKGSKYFSYWLTSTQIISPSLIVIPVYFIMKAFGLLDTYLALIVTHLAFCIPFTTWIFKAFLDSIPNEIEEAALLDGCSRIQALFKVIMPIAAPGVVAVSVFSFIVSWQEFIFAVTLTFREPMRTLPVGMSLFLGEYRVMWGWVMAGATLAVLPVIIVFLYLQKYIIMGLTAGAIKR